MSGRALYPHGTVSNGGSSQPSSSQLSSDASDLKMQLRSGAGLDDDESFASWNLTQSSSSMSAENIKYGNRFGSGRRSGEYEDEDTYSNWSEGELSSEIFRLYDASTSTAPPATPIIEPDAFCVPSYSVDSSAFAMFVDNGSSHSEFEDEDHV